MNSVEYIGGKYLLFDDFTKDHLYVKIWFSIVEINIILTIYMYEILQFFFI